VRRDEPDPGIEARDKIGPDVRYRQVTCLRQLLRDHSQCNVALSESYRALAAPGC
jgi:hypothetical protein